MLDAAVAVLLAVLVLAPLLTLLAYSLAESFAPTTGLPDAWGVRWYRELVEQGQAGAALWVSLRIATAAAALALAVGLPAAWWLAGPRSRWAPVAESAVLLRTAVPVVVVAIGTAGLLFRFGGIDSWWALIAAHAAGALPFVAWTARPAFAGVHPDVLRAARDLGAGPARRAFLVLGLTRPAVVAGGLLAFVFSLRRVRRHVPDRGSGPRHPSPCWCTEPCNEALCPPPQLSRSSCSCRAPSWPWAPRG